MHFNIRTIRKNIIDLDSKENALVYKPDIIICTEAWLTDHINFISINGYCNSFNDSRINKSDGTVIYVKNELKYEIINEKYNELCSTSVKIILSNKSTVKVTGIYRCHDFEMKSFISDLEELVKESSECRNLIIGDTNIDLINFNKEAVKYSYRLQENGYQSMIDSYTFPKYGLEKGSCLDNIFMRSKFVATSKKLIYKITDHYSVLLYFHDNSIKCLQKKEFEMDKKKIC